MQNLRSKLIALAAVGILAAVGTLMNSKQAAAAASGPTVTIDGPFPLPVTGTATVSGSVAAAQSGVWNVGISGTPSVSVTSLPAVQLSGTPTVNVATQSGAPLMVVNLSDRGRTPYQSILPDCASGSCQFPPVPAGYRLVVESISVLATFSQSISFFPNAVLIGSSGIVLNFPLSPGQQNTASAVRSLIAYFDSGDQPTVTVIPQTTPTVTLSGYLIDCTTAPCAAIAH